MDNRQVQFLQHIEQHKGILFKIARMYQEDAEDRNDLVQEMMLQLWNAYGSYRGDSKFSTWMYRVALNTAIVFFKKQKRRPDNIPLNAEMDHPAEINNATHKEEQLAVFYKAVRKLSQVEKALIYLYMENRPYNEIAADLGITEVNVRVRLKRVKDKLRDIIKKMNYEY